MLQGGGDAPDLGRHCTSRPRSAHLPSLPSTTKCSRTCCMSPSKSLRPEPRRAPARLARAASEGTPISSGIMRPLQGPERRRA